ncbi:MAG TPA: Crp/Fnr family transcriptional regulator [Kofleriaceae bacterium]|nr:Crp/Fnr family transcriptional regulator [Kofleriaceae bacterium]
MTREPVSDPDRKVLRETLRLTAELADDDLAALEAAARVRRLAAGDVFLRCGDLAVDCGVVLTGFTREYFPLMDGREVTRGFAGPGSYVGSLSDLLARQPARSQVTAERGARLIVFPWARLEALIATRPAWGRFYQRIVERLYLAKAHREYELLALDAEARYARFRALYARLEPQIALRHVASYVGITPEHLSRLRRRLSSAASGSSGQTRARSQPTARSSRSAAARPARRRARRTAPASRR